MVTMANFMLFRFYHNKGEKKTGKKERGNMFIHPVGKKHTFLPEIKSFAK